MAKKGIDVGKVMRLLKQIEKLQEQTKGAKETVLSYEGLEYDNPFFALYSYTESVDVPEERTF